MPVVSGTLAGRRVTAAILASLLLGWGLADVAPPSQAQGQTTLAKTTSVSAITPAQKAAALAGAHGLVNKMAHIKSMKNNTEMVNLFSNHSAGTVGVIMSVVVKIAIGMSQALDQKESGKSPKGLSLNQMNALYSAFEKRWGISGPMPKSPLEHLSPAITRNGRGFLADEITLMDKIGGPSKDSFSKGMGEKTSSFSDSDVTYTVLSPTRVKLTKKPKPGQKPGASLYAVLEDNVWRLDLGDMLTPQRKPAS